MATPARAPRRRQQPLEYNILLTATLCLMAAGAVMVFSASSGRSTLQGQDGTGYLVRYVLYGAVGFVALQAIARTELERITRLTGPLLAAAFVMLVLVKIPGIGVEINGARRWLGAGPLQFQPAEVMKIALVLYAAKLLTLRHKTLADPRQLLPLALVVAPACLLVASQPDLGTALVLAFTTGALLFAAGVPMRTLLIIGGVAVVVISLYALSAPYRRDRLTSFLNPWDHSATIGFQAVQGQIALGSGGFFGRGLGESAQKLFFLPEAHTDFILAVIGEEVGVVGVLAVVFLYGLIAYAGLRVAKNAAGRYAQLVAAGVTALVLCQAILNLFAVLGLAPLTGVPLPFLSYGSTNLIVLLAAMGLLLNVANGGSARLQIVPTARDRQGSGRDVRGDRSRGNSGARGAGAGGRRRAAG